MKIQQMGPIYLQADPINVGDGDNPLFRLVINTHKKYLRLARLNSLLYYSTRTIAGLSSALLPFVVSSYPRLATALAIAVAITVAVDSVYKPRDRWQLYSKATDLLTIAEAKSTGQYEKYKEMFDIIAAAEQQKTDRLVDLKDVLEQVKAATSK